MPLVLGQPADLGSPVRVVNTCGYVVAGALVRRRLPWKTLLLSALGTVGLFVCAASNRSTRPSVLGAPLPAAPPARAPDRHPLRIDRVAPVALAELPRPQGPLMYARDEHSGFVLLPVSGVGYYHFGGTERPDEDAWGEATTIACIEAVGEAWAQRHPHGPRIGVGDISTRRGGRFRPHHEHRRGLDVDVRPVRRQDEGSVRVGQRAYDRAGTRELIDLFSRTCAVRSVLLDDRIVARHMRRVHRCRGHRNHLHVRLAPPWAQPAAIRQRAEAVLRFSNPRPAGPSVARTP